MPDDFVLDALARLPAAEEAGDHPQRRDLLSLLENAGIGRRASDGSITVGRREPAGCILYGPYLHLPQGHYRLSFRCRATAPLMSGQPVLGVDIIVLSRFQLEWRDFTAGELAAGGGGCIDFTVSAEHSRDGGNEGRFEFRFFHLGNAGFALTAVDLASLPETEPPPAPRRYRLLGRLQKTWRGRRTRDGGVTIGRYEPAGLALYGVWPYLRLPRGAYRLLVHADAGPPRRAGTPLLGIEILGESRWRNRRARLLLARRPEPGGILYAAREATAADIAEGSIAVDFAVPAELAIEAGADAPFDIRLYHHGNGALTVRAVDLVRLDRELPVATPRLRPSGRRQIVIIGNCQSETLRQGFVRSEALNRRFDVRYHFVQLPPNLHEYAARDLERADILLVQDIKLWDEFPLQGCVRPGTEMLRFPLVRFASPWPFDAWNGPADKEAYDREAPNLTFPYLDGLLGRLRHEISDPEARFAAYRSLELPGIVNYRRLHQLEERRLAALDRQFGLAIGGFILDNFRSRRLFHTTVRPNWEVFTLLMQFIARLVGVNEPIRLGEGIDSGLRNPQVPVHPEVGRALDVKWADEKTRYLNRGREITWEDYIRRYIAHYG